MTTKSLSDAKRPVLTTAAHRPDGMVLPLLAALRAHRSVRNSRSSPSTIMGS